MSNRPVVVAVPPSGELSALLSFGVAQASRTGAELRLVHAFDVWPVSPEADELALDLRHAERQAEHVLRRARDEVRALPATDLAVTTCTVRGSVVATLVKASEDAGLVVVQRRKHRGAARVLTRSLSCGVASKAHCAVAVVPDQPVASRHGVVTVGVDAPERAAVLLEQALEEAAHREATLRVMHLVLHVGGLGEYLVEQATATRHLVGARADIEAAVADAHRTCPHVAVDIDVRRVDPAEALVLESRRTDVLLVGRHDPAIAVGSHLGPVAGAVVRESACPVVVVAPTRRHRRPEGGATPDPRDHRS